MTSEQLGEWIAYYQIEPWGNRVEEYRIGTLISYLLAPHIKKGIKLPKWDQIFPDPNKVAKKQEKQSMDEMKSILLSMVSEK